MIKVELYPFEAIDAGLRANMVALRDAQSIYDSPFFDLDFAELISGVRADVRVAVAQDEKGLLGYWPLHVRPDKWARAIGGAFSDWHGPVLRQGEQEVSPEEFLKQAGLKGMTANGLRPPGLSASCRGDISACGIAQTPNGGLAYRELMTRLHPKHYKNLRRAERLSERDFGRMDVIVDDTSIDAFEWLMASKQAHYLRTGKHNVLGPLWVQSMMAKLRTERFPRLRGRLSTLRLDGKFAAAEFDLLSDKVVHGWITVFDQDYASYSPGHLLLLSVICDMENTGHEICDIGAGAHAYTKYYESYQQPVERAILETGLGARPAAAAWRMIEARAPGSLSGLMASMRRRGDQIFGSDISPQGRLSGLAQAVLRKR